MPDAKLLLICAVAVLACFVVGAVWRSRPRDERMLVQQNPPSPPLKGSFDAASRRIDVALGQESVQLLEDGERAQAIALVRERTGWGAAEAEGTVERLENLRKRMGL
jgi:hypothetical protein